MLHMDVHGSAKPRIPSFRERKFHRLFRRMSFVVRNISAAIKHDDAAYIIHMLNIPRRCHRAAIPGALETNDFS